MVSPSSRSASGTCRGIDEPERVFEIAIDDLPSEEPVSEPEHEPEPESKPPVPADTATTQLDRDIARRFEDLGTRLAAGIQERIMKSLTGVGPQGDASAVDDIAERMASLGDEIDARVQAALAKKGVPPPTS